MATAKELLNQNTAYRRKVSNLLETVDNLSSELKVVSTIRENQQVAIKQLHSKLDSMKGEAEWLRTRTFKSHALHRKEISDLQATIKELQAKEGSYWSRLWKAVTNG